MRINPDRKKPKKRYPPLLSWDIYQQYLIHMEQEQKQKETPKNQSSHEH